jgi:hypothetical protein
MKYDDWPEITSCSVKSLGIIKAESEQQRVYGDIPVLDYFAGQALPAVMARHPWSAAPDDIAAGAYDIAEAMMRRRANPE